MASNTNTNRDSLLRGMGRQAYRDGVMMFDVPAYTIRHVGELSLREREVAMGGWRAERSDLGFE